jgi:2-polyprenyl-3-methyl-5-hydroxy-6-metoxy-1,4-benzoquinol methylase
MDDRLHRHPLGFWQVRDMPDACDLRAYYRERYFQSSHGNYRPEYGPAERAWFDIRTARIAAAVRQSGGVPTGRLLDVGCGEGFGMAWFDRQGWQVHGIDMSEAGVQAMNPHLRGHVELGDLADLLAAQGRAGRTYDLVWLTNVLEHVPDPLRLLADVRPLLAPGGRAVVTVPNDASDWQETLFHDGRIPQRFWIAIPDHLAYFDRSSLSATAQAAGLECLRILADFPIDWFLGNPESEYISAPAKGKGAHQARVAVDTVLASQPVERVNDLYEALAAVGMGRQLTAILA